MNIIAKIKSLIHRGEEPDWRNPAAVPKEVLSEEELNALEKGVIAELQNADLLRPEALFYISQYIDSKFDKNNFNIESYFIKKQDIIDGLYATGLGELHASLTGYTELLAEYREVSKRYFSKLKSLGGEISPNAVKALDEDAAELVAEVNSIPNNLEWRQ